MTDQAQEVQETSKEEKFFGVKTQIGKKAKDQEEPQSDIELEVIDDRPEDDRRPAKKTESTSPNEDDELGNYSEKVQKRINKLRYEQHEERRQREAAEKMREEAVRYAQQQAEKIQQYESLINQGEERLVNEIKTKAALAVESAKSKYRKAYEEGDTDGVVNNQEAMIAAQAELKEAENWEKNYQQRVAQHQAWAQAQQQVRQEPQPKQQFQQPRPSALAEEWAEKNTWFGNPAHKDMTALAYGIHESLVNNEGIQPDTQEYFQQIDRRMRERFSDYDWPSAPSRSPSNVVTPSSRNNGSKPRKVKLTRTQIALAKRLGLTPEQYAKELTKGI